MNCKPGDLAVIVKGIVENQGRIVRVLRQYIDGDVLPTHRIPYEDGGGFSWVVESAGAPLRIHGKIKRYSQFHVCFDASLRPIRPQPDDAKDETLLWLPVPSRERETA